ncbi:MAG: hypothetical protein F6J95_017110 [Leptolyngbya sp. SIO1E4]|nr:hypothetical protein [Leptolyngbya sp. SIO1E4]
MTDKAPHFTIQTSFALILSTALGITLGIAPAIADGIPGVTLGTETGAETPGPQPVTTPADDTYTEAMLVGYAAAEQGDFQTALINFQRALEARPGDQYALAAIANMETYLEQQRQEAIRRQRLVDLQVVVESAVQASDWACAAASVDEMITLVPTDSLDRSRLVAYRGELSALLDARADIDNWSTICPG